jgi:hypothetical protein
MSLSSLERCRFSSPTGVRDEKKEVAMGNNHAIVVE